MKALSQMTEREKKALFILDNNVDHANPFRRRLARMKRRELLDSTVSFRMLDMRDDVTMRDD